MATELLTVEDLADLLKRSPATIHSDVHRKPEALPPSFRLPGTRRLLWRREDVDQWLADLQETQAKARYRFS